MTANKVVGGEGGQLDLTLLSTMRRVISEYVRTPASFQIMVDT